MQLNQLNHYKDECLNQKDLWNTHPYAKQPMQYRRQTCYAMAHGYVGTGMLPWARKGQIGTIWNYEKWPCCDRYSITLRPWCDRCVTTVLLQLYGHVGNSTLQYSVIRHGQIGNWYVTVARPRCFDKTRHWLWLVFYNKARPRWGLVRYNLAWPRWDRCALIKKGNGKTRPWLG